MIMLIIFALCFTPFLIFSIIMVPWVWKNHEDLKIFDFLKIPFVILENYLGDILIIFFFFPVFNILVCLVIMLNCIFTTLFMVIAPVVKKCNIEVKRKK